MDSEMLNKIKKGKIYAIIPARAGSKGVKDKNIKCLKGYPMMAYSIAAAKLCGLIDRVIVSTDSEKYAAVARYYGAETPFLRPAEFAVDSSPDIDFMKHAIWWLSENENLLPEIFVHIRPTTPLRDVAVINQSIETFLSDDAATSLRSSHLCRQTPYKWFHINDDGYYRPLFSNMTVDEVNSPRQSFAPVYIAEGYVDVLSTRFIISNDLMHGNKCKSFVIEPSIDVDAQKDFEAVEVYLKENGHELYSYLRDHYKSLNEVQL